MRTDELDFHLPPELIAQEPLANRSAAQLLHYRRSDGAVAHRHFTDLPGMLRPGDLLVFNDTRVVPARFMLSKPTKGKVEGLFLDEPRRGVWHVLLRDVGKMAVGSVLQFTEKTEVTAKIIERHGEGEHLIEVDGAISAAEFLESVGRMPLPPYIKRQKGHDLRDEMDKREYQTVYAQDQGSVAAPTAGLHFTQELLKELERRGIERTFVTLHVGMGTFKPVSAERLDQHVMHTESYSISAEAAESLNRAKRENRRIIPVGTTSARVLESQGEIFAPRQDQTNIFIYPPYRWKHVSALITNFHLPRSTLIALVAAMVGLEEQRRLYAIAIENHYRFFSYGDGMLME